MQHVMLIVSLAGIVLLLYAAWRDVAARLIPDEISIALICTAMGLGTAIPLGYILSALNIRVRSLQDSLEASVARVLEHFRH